MCYFCCSGKGKVFNLDEITGALTLSHELKVSSKDYPGQCSLHYP